MSAVRNRIVQIAEPISEDQGKVQSGIVASGPPCHSTGELNASALQA